MLPHLILDLKISRPEDPQTAAWKYGWICRYFGKARGWVFTILSNAEAKDEEITDWQSGWDSCNNLSLPALPEGTNPDTRLATAQILNELYKADYLKGLVSIWQVIDSPAEVPASNPSKETTDGP